MKTCKKLFSLLLVAVMLVAAIPTFAFADKINATGVTVKAVCNTVPIGSGTCDLTDFDLSDPTHIKNAVAYSMTLDDTLYEVSNQATFADNTLTVQLTLKNHAPDYKKLVSFDQNGHTYQCSVLGCSDTKTEPHGSSEIASQVAATDATCTEAGKTAKITYKCGAVVGGIDDPAKPALGHDFDSTTGKCKHAGCDATDPNWKGTTGGGSGSTLLVRLLTPRLLSTLMVSSMTAIL